MLYKAAGKLWKVMPRSMRIFASRSIQTKFTVSAAGVITNAAGEVLLLNHLLRPVSGWGVPGGFLESGEQPEAGFRREILEETGLELHNVRLYRTRTLRRHIEIIFVAETTGDAKVMSKEILSLGWFNSSTIPPEMSLDQQFLVRRALGWDSEKQ